jgi:hypothetical protein
VNILLIEDEADFVDRIKVGAASHCNCRVWAPSDVGLNLQFDQSSAIEDQLRSRLRTICLEKAIDLVLLDSDLSRIRNGISQSACRDAFRTLGVPVCRYKKKQSSTPAMRLSVLARQAQEGSSSIWLSAEIVNDPEERLMPWLDGVAKGFASLNESLEASSTLQKEQLGPAGILAALLGAPATSTDFLGYTSQNLFFFGGSLTESEGGGTALPKHWATPLGYWLLNYVIAFPGPILTSEAVAAFLNLKLESLALPEVDAIIQVARYGGPFSSLMPLYWLDSLSQLLVESEGDISKHPDLMGIELKRVDTENPESSAYLCVLTQQPITAEDSTKPDWIPPGAQLSRVNRDDYDRLGPLLNI